jgi:hypothetical protein
MELPDDTRWQPYEIEVTEYNEHGESLVKV